MVKILSALLCVAAFSLQTASGQVGASFDKSQWIWSWPDPGSNSTRDMGMACAYFRVDLTLPQPSSVVKADVFLTADNLYALYVNGKYVGQSDANPNKWNQPKRFDVAGLLVPGRNVVAIEAANTAPGPAGLIVQGVVQLADGQQVVLTSGDQWKCNEKKQKNWEQVAFDDAKWQKAYLVAPYGSAPWGKFRPQSRRPCRPRSRNWAKRLRWRSVWSRPACPFRSSCSTEVAPPADYPWPEAIVFLGDDCSLYRPASTPARATTASA